jgi:predicted transcriptional regulator
MKVLLSIKPEFTARIFDGSKRYEYRRVIHKDRTAKIAIVYASSHVRKVIGEFEIEDILDEELLVLWSKTEKYAGIDKQRFFAYFKNKSRGYAIKIGKTTLYCPPLSLSSLGIPKPPQSFRYLL